MAESHGSERRQLMQSKVQNAMSTTRPRRPTRVSGGELIHDAGSAWVSSGASRG
jgi:hypothetical protein